MTKKKTDYLEVIDRKFDDLETKISELEKKVENNHNDLKNYIETVTEISFYDTIIGLRIFYLGQVLIRGEIKDFDVIMEDIKDKEKTLQKKKKRNYEIRFIPNDYFLGLIIAIAKIWTIPFEKLAPYLIKNLGKDLPKRLVKSEDLIDQYGKKALEIWKLLLEKRS